MLQVNITIDKGGAVLTNNSRHCIVSKCIQSSSGLHPSACKCTQCLNMFYFICPYTPRNSPCLYRVPYSFQVSGGFKEEGNGLQILQHEKEIRNGAYTCRL